VKTVAYDGSVVCAVDYEGKVGNVIEITVEEAWRRLVSAYGVQSLPPPRLERPGG
jgi:hypothetical protein